MSRDTVVAALRRYGKMREEVYRMEEALEELEESQRDIIAKFYINPVPRVAEEICEMFEIDKSTVYRRRDKALKMLEDCLR